MNAEQYTHFKTIFQNYYTDLVKIALFYTHDVATAEDITQEIFTKLWEKRDKLETVDNLKGYLSFAVKNKCLNHLEHQQVINRYRQEYLQATSEDNQPDELIQKVQASLKKLPSKRRKILEMSIVESKSYQEIAIIQGISINTVKDHIKKAYVFLRQDIQRDIQDIILFFAFYIP